MGSERASEVTGEEEIGEAQDTPATLVVDTGVAAKWYLNEPLEDEAARLLEAGEQDDFRLTAPDAMPTEFFNILWSHHAGRRGVTDLLSLEDLRTYWEAFAATPVDLFRSGELTRRAAEITIDTGVLVYDTLFLTLAESLQATLITTDQKTILNRIKGTSYEPLAIHLENVEQVLGKGIE